MKRIIILSSVVSWLVFISTPPTIIAKKVFDLAEIKAYAIRHSPQLNVKRADITKEKGERLQTRSWLLPTISLQGDYTHYKREHGVMEGIKAQEFDDDRLSGGVRRVIIAI